MSRMTLPAIQYCSSADGGLLTHISTQSLNLQARLLSLLIRQNAESAKVAKKKRPAASASAPSATHCPVWTNLAHGSFYCPPPPSQRSAFTCTFAPSIIKLRQNVPLILLLDFLLGATLLQCVPISMSFFSDARSIF